MNDKLFSQMIGIYNYGNDINVKR